MRGQVEVVAVQVSQVVVDLPVFNFVIALVYIHMLIDAVGRGWSDLVNHITVVVGRLAPHQNFSGLHGVSVINHVNRWHLLLVPLPLRVTVVPI